MTNAVPTARTEVEIRTEPLGGSPLARLVIAGEAPSSWLERCPTGADAWRERVDAVLASATPDWAERLAPAFDARGAPRRSGSPGRPAGAASSSRRGSSLGSSAGRSTRGSRR